MRLAMHHQDPPTPYLRGEARILSTFEGMKRFVETVHSPGRLLGFGGCRVGPGDECRQTHGNLGEGLQRFHLPQNTERPPVPLLSGEAPGAQGRRPRVLSGARVVSRSARRLPSTASARLCLAEAPMC